MKSFFTHSRYLLFFFVLGISILGHAQNSLGFDAKTKGFAGAGIAITENSIHANSNPGGQVFVGNKFSLGIELLAPKALYSIKGSPSVFTAETSQPWKLGLEPGSYQSEHKYSIVPHVSLNLKIDNNNSIGLSIYGNGNQGTQYSNKVYFSPVINSFGSSEGFVNPMGIITTPSYIKLLQYFGALSYSHKFGQKLGIGISVVGVWQSIDVGGLESFGSLYYTSYPDKISTNSTDNAFGVGGKLGIQWEATSVLSIGVTFRSKIYTTRFTAYEGLINQNGKMDIPSEWSIGVAWKPTNRILILADVNRYCFSGVKSWGTKFYTDDSYELGGENGGGFGRKDRMSYKAGIRYKIPLWQFRAGYQYSSSVLNESDLLLNILMPEVIQHYASVGISRQLGKQTINIAVVKGFKNSIQGINSLDNNQNIEISAESLSIAVSVDF
jgi:long-chain fatty acid transport protein